MIERLQNRLAIVLAASLLAACGDDSPTGPGGAGTGAALPGGGGGGGQGGAPMPDTSSSSSTGLPALFTVHGIVVDDAGDPVEGAVVMQGGGEIQGLCWAR